MRPVPPRRPLEPQADEIARSDDDIVIAPRNPTKEAVVAYTTFPEGSLGEELRILLSNFLLYVTLVIATAGLQHYYFPDSIAAGEAAAAAPAPAPATDDADESEAPLVDVGDRAVNQTALKVHCARGVGRACS